MIQILQILRCLIKKVLFDRLPSLLKQNSFCISCEEIYNFYSIFSQEERFCESIFSHIGWKYSEKSLPFCTFHGEQYNASTPCTSFSKQVVGRSVKKAKSALPRSSLLKVKVLSALVGSLTPRTKQNVFSNARKSLGLGDRGRPSKIIKNKIDDVSFLQQPDISYCAPSRKDTVLCGKLVEGEKIYCAKHYLLYSIKELVEFYNHER